MSQYKELLAKIELLRIEAEAARIAENAERDLDTKGLPPTVLAYIEATKLASRLPRKDTSEGLPARKPQTASTKVSQTPRPIKPPSPAPVPKPKLPPPAPLYKLPKGSQVRYFDPDTGEVWSGERRVPQWLQDKEKRGWSRDLYEVKVKR